MILLKGIEDERPKTSHLHGLLSLARTSFGEMRSYTRDNDPRSPLSCLVFPDRLVGLVGKASASRAEDPEFESRLQWDFSGVESYQ